MLTARLNNSFRQFGNDMLKTVCIGETIWAFDGAGGINSGMPAPSYADAVRMILDSGIRVGAGSDARNTFPGNPWVGIQYMVTGKDRSGILDNAGQTLTRLEALRLYTAANGWFSKEEDVLGSVEVGKFGDLVVLNKNFLDAREVADEAINRLSTLLTIVDGKVVHDAGAIGRRK